MNNNHRSVYRVRNGFRDTDGTYYQTGTELNLFKDPHVISLEREGRLEEVKEIKPKAIFRDENEMRKAVERGESYPHVRRPSERCPKGYHVVMDHFRKPNGRSSMVLEVEGVYVSEHCAKNPRRR